MACIRQCSSKISLCESELCCIQFLQDCGTGCDGLAVGYSRLQISAEGVLQVCSNVNGNCICADVTTGGSDSLVDNGNGTITHVDTDGNIVTIDVCDLLLNSSCLDSLVDNGDGTITHTNVGGDVITLDICEILKDAFDQSPWVNMTLTAGWVAEAGQQTPQFKCDCLGRVQLRGCIEGTPTNGSLPSIIATIPANDGQGHPCRPAATIRFGSGCSAIEIDSSGVVTTSPSTSLLYRCFNGDSFLVN